MTSFRSFVEVPKNVTATSSVDTRICSCYSGNTIFALDFGVLKQIGLVLCRGFLTFPLFVLDAFFQPSPTTRDASSSVPLLQKTL